MRNRDQWIQEPVPAHVTELGARDRERVIQRFDTLVETRSAPIGDTSRSSKFAFFWPKPPLVAKAVPGGVTSLDEEEGFDYDKRLDEFFSLLNSRIYFWAIGSHDLGVFEGPYNEEVRWWIQRNIIVSPTVLMARDLDVVLIANEQWHFSVVGGPQKEIAILQGAFGGESQLRKSFIEWVERDGVGFGDEGREWACKYPVRWSGWSE